MQGVQAVGVPGCTPSQYLLGGGTDRVCSKKALHEVLWKGKQYQTSEIRTF